jgi:hypothetical protein
MKTKYSITELLALRGNAAVDIGQFTICALESEFYWATTYKLPNNSAR